MRQVLGPCGALVLEDWSYLTRLRAAIPFLIRNGRETIHAACRKVESFVAPIFRRATVSIFLFDRIYIVYNCSLAKCTCMNKSHKSRCILSQLTFFFFTKGNLRKDLKLLNFLLSIQPRVHFIRFFFLPKRNVKFHQIFFFYLSSFSWRNSRTSGKTSKVNTSACWF